MSYFLLGFLFAKPSEVDPTEQKRQGPNLPEELQQVAESLCKLALVAQGVVPVEVLLVGARQKHAHQGRRVAEALQAAIHEAGVAQVAQPGQAPGPAPLLQPVQTCQSVAESERVRQCTKIQAHSLLLLHTRSLFTKSHVKSNSPQSWKE